MLYDGLFAVMPSHFEIGMKQLSPLVASNICILYQSKDHWGWGAFHLKMSWQSSHWNLCEDISLSVCTKFCISQCFLWLCVPPCHHFSFLYVSDLLTIFSSNFYKDAPITTCAFKNVTGYPIIITGDPNSDSDLLISIAFYNDPRLRLVEHLLQLLSCVPIC